MAKARNRNLSGLAGLAGLGALGYMMARGGKKSAEEAALTPVEDRGIRAATTPAAADISSVPAAVGIDRPDDRDIGDVSGASPSGLYRSSEGGDIFSMNRPAAQAAARPTATTARQTRPTYSAQEAAYDLARESSRGAGRTSAAAPTPSGLTLGTPIRPDPRAPSIYAGPEAWAEYRKRQAAGMKKGGAVKAKKMASGGSVSSASKRGDGIAQRGKTRGRMI